MSPVVRQCAAHHRRWIRLEGVTIQIQENVPLAQFTTLGVGGPARWFAHVTSQHELLEAVAFARERSLPIFILGGGSNLLVADAGFRPAS